MSQGCDPLTGHLIRKQVSFPGFQMLLPLALSKRKPCSLLLFKMGDGVGCKHLDDGYQLTTRWLTVCHMKGMVRSDQGWKALHSLEVNTRIPLTASPQVTCCHPLVPAWNALAVGVWWGLTPRVGRFDVLEGWLLKTHANVLFWKTRFIKSRRKIRSKRIMCSTQRAG